MPHVYLLHTQPQGSGVSLNLQLTAIVAELPLFNFNTVIFNTSRHAAPLPHPSITPTFHLDLSDVLSLVANSHFVVENEMCLLPSDLVTLWAAGCAGVFTLIFYSNLTRLQSPKTKLQKQKGPVLPLFLNPSNKAPTSVCARVDHSFMVKSCCLCCGRCWFTLLDALEFTPAPFKWNH